VAFPLGGNSSSARTGGCRSQEELKRLAKDFFDQYFACIKRLNSHSHRSRVEAIFREIDEGATYSLTETELVYGAKLAWRNSVRCIGRIQWAKLQVKGVGARERERIKLISNPLLSDSPFTLSLFFLSWDELEEGRL